MSPFSALNGLRVGCVQYLNAKPLIVPYDGAVVFEHPARLADLLDAGEIDMALIPIFEALRHPAFPIVDNVAIASHGAVYSVIMAYCGALSELRSVSLDPASRTSNNLLQCLLAEFHGVRPAIKGAEKSYPHGDHGVVLIGDQAIRFREKRHDGVEYLDMGEEWFLRTGLPFVFAVWQLRPEIANPAAVAEALRAIKEAGLRRIREIGRLQRDFDPAFATQYLTHHVQFHLGEKEKVAIGHFRCLLEKHGLIEPSEVALRFV